MLLSVFYDGFYMFYASVFMSVYACFICAYVCVLFVLCMFYSVMNV